MQLGSFWTTNSDHIHIRSTPKHKNPTLSHGTATYWAVEHTLCDQTVIYDPTKASRKSAINSRFSSDKKSSNLDSRAFDANVTLTKSCDLLP